MARTDLTRIPDRGELRRLASGLIITRARKHEPIRIEDLSADELKRVTDKIRGSKFMSDWTLTRVTDWIQEQIESEPIPLGEAAVRKVKFESPVGYSDGKKVYTITIRSDGRYVHAYPDRDL
jgi:hypothetical protein